MNLDNVDSKWINFQMIMAQTEKAVMLCIDAESNSKFWMPRSQVKGVVDINGEFKDDISELMDGGKILISNWFYDKVSKEL